jgi:histone-lysine N-methyltransferase SETMAR
MHDNGRPHVVQLTQRKITQFRWKVFAHSPYSPDLAPSDYYFFRSLRNHLCDKQYEGLDEIQSNLTAFFESRAANLYRGGIDQLPTRWTKVVENDGNYIVD